MAKAGGGSLRTLLWVAGLMVVMVVLPACGVADGLDRLQETVAETFDDAEPASSPASGVVVREDRDRWTEYVDEAGLYTIDFPAEPDYTSEDGNDGTVGGWSTRSESNDYRINEFDISFGMSYDFDAGVADTIDGAARSIEERLGRSAIHGRISTVRDSRGGHEGVHFVAPVVVEGKPYATVHGAVYNTGDRIVMISMIDTGSDDERDAERFLRSLRFTS